MRLGISLLISVAGSVGIWGIVVVMPEIQAELGLSRADATFPFVATMIGFATGNLLMGRAVDRWGISPVLVAAALCSAVGFAGSAMADGLWVLTVLHLFAGLGASVCFGPLIADVSQWFRLRRGIAVAVTASGNYLSGAFWPPIIVWVNGDDGWRLGYGLLAISCVAVLVPGAYFLRRQVNAESTARATAEAASQAATTGLAPRALQALLAIAGVGCCVAMAMPQVHIVALCIDRGFGAAAGAEMLSLMLIGGVVSRLASGWASDRVGGLPVLLVGSVLQMSALCLFLVQGGMGSLYLISLIFGLSQGGIVPSYAMIVRQFMPPREAGRRVGVVMFATVLGMALGGWLSGWIYDLTGSYDAAIWNGIGWNLMNATIVIMIMWRIGGDRRIAAPSKA